MIMKEAAHLPARAAQEAGIPEVLLLTAGTDTVQGRQEGQAVPRAVRGQEEEPPGEVLPQAIVRRREVHRTMGAAAMGEAVTSKVPVIIDAVIDKDENVLPMIPAGKPVVNPITEIDLNA